MATLGICAFSDRKQNGYAGYSGGGVGGRRRDGVPWELKGRQINGEPDVSWPQDRGLRHSGRRAAGSAGGRAVPLAVPGPGPVGRRLPRRLRPEGPAGPAPRAGRSSLPSRRRRGAVANMAAKVSEWVSAALREGGRRRGGSLGFGLPPPAHSHPPSRGGGEAGGCPVGSLAAPPALRELPEERGPPGRLASCQSRTAGPAAPRLAGHPAGWGEGRSPFCRRVTRRTGRSGGRRGGGLGVRGDRRAGSG